MSQTNDFAVGDSIRAAISINDTEGNPIDASDLKLTVKPPKSAIETFDAVRDAAGEFHCDITLDQSGPWYYRWSATMPVPLAAEGAIDVSGSRFVQS